MRRWMVGLGVAVVVLGGLGAPARAATDWLDVYLGNLTVAADSPGKAISPLLFAATPTAAEDLEITVDFRGLAGVATISAYAPGELTCTAGADVLTCSADEPVSLDTFGLDVLPLLVEPAAGAALGASGTMTVTARAKGVTTATHQAKVTVGEGVDLSSGDAVQVSAAVGASVPLPLSVTNQGTTAVRGAVLWLSPEYALRVGKQYSNCRYPAGWLLVVCHFDTTLEPGQTYALASPLPFTVGADTPAPGTASAAGQWLTPAEWADFEGLLRDRGVPVGAAGTAGALSLAPVVSALVDPPQADVEPSNNGVFVDVNVVGSNKTDLAAVGASGSGSAGASVVTRIGVKNLGPALADGDGSSITPVHVTVPPHSTAVKVPAGCTARAGGREYLCDTTAWLPVGATSVLEFTLRVDRVTANATGRVEINNARYGQNVETAAKRANDTAAIVLNAATSTGGSGGSGGGSSDSDDETLPITGANIALIAGAGALLVALGLLALLTTRRRSS